MFVALWITNTEYYAMFVQTKHYSDRIRNRVYIETADTPNDIIYTNTDGKRAFHITICIAESAQEWARATQNSC